MFTTARDTRDAKDNGANVAKENMISEGGPAVHDLKESARRFKGDARDAAAAVRDDLEEVARKTGQHVRDLADSAGHNAADIAESMTGKIRNHPIQSSVIALGVGFIVGMLYRR